MHDSLFLPPSFLVGISWPQWQHAKTVRASSTTRVETSLPLALAAAREFLADFPRRPFSPHGTSDRDCRVVHHAVSLCWSPSFFCAGFSDLMASADDVCFEPGAGTNSLLGLRVGGLFGILVASAIGVTIPFLANVEKHGTLFFLLRAFAGGVVLATGKPFFLPGLAY